MAIQVLENLVKDEFVVRNDAIEVAFGFIPAHSSIVIGRDMFVVAVAKSLARRFPIPGWRWCSPARATASSTALMISGIWITATSTGVRVIVWSPYA